MEKERDFAQTVKRVGITTIIWNVLLSVVKMIAGILAKSSAMVSDAVHSASDIFTTLIVMIGAKMSSKASDSNHEYGHERFEPIASVFLAVMLAVTAIGIGYSGVKSIIDGSYAQGDRGAFVYLALGGAILSIVVKGVMFLYTNKAAGRIRSNSLKADAWHHLSDSLSSVGSMLGIVGLIVGKGWQIMDPIAAIVICLVILKVVFDILKEAVDQLVDKSIPDDLAKEILDVIGEQDGVIDVLSFKSRQFSSKMYLDIEISVSATLSLVEADRIAEGLHTTLEKRYPDLKHCTIWAKPATTGELPTGGEEKRSEDGE